VNALSRLRQIFWANQGENSKEWRKKSLSEIEYGSFPDKRASFVRTLMEKTERLTTQVIMFNFNLFHNHSSNSMP